MSSLRNKESHPLLIKAAAGLEDICTWDQWIRAWVKAVEVWKLEALLELVFELKELSEEDHISRCVFLLEVADGHEYSSSFGLGVLNEHRCDCTLGRNLTVLDIVRKLSEVAFEQLCKHVFVDTSKDGAPPSWLHDIRHPELLDKVIWFFRPQEFGTQPALENLGRSGGDDHKTVRTFLIALATLAFRWRSYSSRECGWNVDELKRQLSERRPKFVELLWGLKKLDVLLARGVEMNRASMQKLRWLACTYEAGTSPDGDARHREMSHALQEYSRAAEVYWLLKTRKELYEEASE